MIGVLNYCAPRVANRRGSVFGIVSACFATCVFSLPMAVLGVSRVIEGMFRRPGAVILPQQVGLLVLVIPSLAMLILPLLGLLFGTAGVMANRRQVSDCAKIGLIVNASALVTVVCFVMQN